MMVKFTDAYVLLGLNELTVTHISQAGSVMHHPT